MQLNDFPKRIEVYDNSHTFGKESVGVMIVVDEEGLSPKNYRKYNIRYNLGKDNQPKIDDYYMMSEVLNRRFKNVSANEEILIPDIIIIDGGRGQYNIAKEVLLQRNIKDITLLSISKGKDRNSGREIIHISDKNINLKPDNPLLYFIQRVRDEAHRFAITAHRSRKRRNTLKSIFDDIPGIGPKRKKELIIHFGSLNKIKNASLSEIKSVKNITEKIANKIYDFFNSH